MSIKKSRLTKWDVSRKYAVSILLVLNFYFKYFGQNGTSAIEKLVFLHFRQNGTSASEVEKWFFSHLGQNCCIVHWTLLADNSPFSNIWCRAYLMKINPEFSTQWNFGIYNRWISILSKILCDEREKCRALIF